MMILWDRHQEFTPDFLARHHDYVLFDLFHQVKASVLYPLNCGCQSGCPCGGLREKIVLSLNVDAYNQAEARQEHPDRLYAMKLLFKIPDDTFFRKHQGEAYPVWLIQKELQKRETHNHFKIVGRLVWGLLRLAQTYEFFILGGARASIKEAVELILGKTPLKAKARKQEQEPYLCGEKGYSAQLNAYKTVCHFVAAFQFMGKGAPCFSLSCPDKIREFLTLSHWFRKNLLALQTPNVKGNALFSETTLLPLPAWINSKDINISIDPFEEKLREIEADLKKPYRDSPKPP